jgi:hypothetical protein
VINTFGSTIVPSFSIGLSTNEFGLTIHNVSDGVYCLFPGNCAKGIKNIS